MVGFKTILSMFCELGLGSDVPQDAEWTFGTLVQRLLEFLTVRMHYGHPDFMDAFWAANRGSVSKASPHINLSEDIFAGLNVKTRHEQSLHTEARMKIGLRMSSFYFYFFIF